MDVEVLLAIYLYIYKIKLGGDLFNLNGGVDLFNLNGGVDLFKIYSFN